MDKDLQRIASSFDIAGEITGIAPLGNGLINDTFKITTSDGTPDYVLQRINDAIFTNVPMLQSNIETVTAHIRNLLEAEGTPDIDRKVLRFVPVKGGGRTWLADDGKFWRVSVFIDRSVTLEVVNEESSRLAGREFGHFESMLADLEAPIGDIIPDFHNIEFRLKQLVDAVHDDKAGRLSDPQVGTLLDEIDRHAVDMCLGERLFREGKLPKRICHCDTKVNNMLFDENGEVLCVIDLDTVMRSFVFSDYGDFLRSAANTAAEDEPDLSKVDFNMDIFKAFTEGYLEGTASFLTDIEKENLPYAACLFPYMQAVRFLTDYINGDTYYKIKYPGHNLTRTLAQMQLFRSALYKVPQMREFLGI